MVRCKQCNAPIGPAADACEFCGTLTAEGYAKRAAEEARLQAAALAEQQRIAAEQKAARDRQYAEVLSKGTGSLVMSIVGVVLMCAPVFPLVGFVLGLRARAAARRAGFQVPGRATASVVVGGLSFMLGVGFWILAVYLSVEESKRKAELTPIAARGEQAETLDPATACALAELYLLESGYEGYSISNSFDCSRNRVVQTGRRAVLKHASMEIAGDVHPVSLCFDGSDRWKVTEARKDDQCAGASATPPAAPATAQDSP